MREVIVCLATLFLFVPSQMMLADDIKQLHLRTNDILYDRRNQTIYATVPGSGGSVGNSITPIYPCRGVIGSPIFVGGEPNKLSISDNGE